MICKGACIDYSLQAKAFTGTISEGEKVCQFVDTSNEKVRVSSDYEVSCTNDVTDDIMLMSKSYVGTDT